MARIAVGQTEANLLRAFVSAALTSRHYHAAAVLAEADGRVQVADLLRCFAQHRADQAEGHQRMLDGLDDALTGCAGKDVGGAVSAAIANEGDRSAAYAGMARTARDEGFDEIADWFELLAKASRSHVRRLQHTLDCLTEQGFIGFGR